jgi:predicted GTPase
MAPPFKLDVRNVILIDTPGLDDSSRSEIITHFLEQQ